MKKNRNFKPIETKTIEAEEEDYAKLLKLLTDRGATVRFSGKEKSEVKAKIKAIANVDIEGLTRPENIIAVGHACAITGRLFYDETVEPNEGSHNHTKAEKYLRKAVKCDSQFLANLVVFFHKIGRSEEAEKVSRETSGTLLGYCVDTSPRDLPSSSGSSNNYKVEPMISGEQYNGEKEDNKLKKEDCSVDTKTNEEKITEERNGIAVTSFRKSTPPLTSGKTTDTVR